MGHNNIVDFSTGNFPNEGFHIFNRIIHCQNLTKFVCRAFIYEAVEDFLFKFGMDGKACLLRAICETHESPLIGYGLFGEFINLFLS